MERPAKKYYRIGEVSSLTGVEPHILRYWESEFRIRPHRVASQRLYRDEDISLIRRIRDLLHEQGYTIAGARRLLTGEGRLAARQEKIFMEEGYPEKTNNELIRQIRAELAQIKEMLSPCRK